MLLLVLKLEREKNWNWWIVLIPLILGVPCVIFAKVADVVIHYRKEVRHVDDHVRASRTKVE